MFWLPEEKETKFIDWQKVSLGDPAFMIAQFARRFEAIWNEESDTFVSKALKAYKEKKQINHIDELFQARLFERAVSDMLWSVWAAQKKRS